MNRTNCYHNKIQILPKTIRSLTPAYQQQKFYTKISYPQKTLIIPFLIFKQIRLYAQFMFNASQKEYSK